MSVHGDNRVFTFDSHPGAWRKSGYCGIGLWFATKKGILEGDALFENVQFGKAEP
jgi:hypothetical protein